MKKYLGRRPGYDEKKSNSVVGSALDDAKKLERIMIYLIMNSYKVVPEEGIMLTNEMLGLTTQIVDRLQQFIQDGGR